MEDKLVVTSGKREGERGNMDGPQIIILREVSQKKKDKYHMIPLICGI